MIDLNFNNNTYPMHNTWEELSPNEFKQIIPYMVLVMNEQMSVQECRVMSAFVLTGLEPRRFADAKIQDRFNENIFRISQAVDFLFRIEYENKKAFNRLKKDVKAVLYRFLPEELDEKIIPEVIWARKQKYKVEPDLVFAKNIIPEIRKKGKKLKGYSFELNDEILDCSLSFIQMVNAQDLSNQYFKKPNETILNRIIATLYYPGKYYADQVQTVQIPNIDALTKQAILFNFNAILTFLYTRTKYSILFNDSDTKKPTKNRNNKQKGIGLIGFNFSLMKMGYGDHENSPALKVFDMMYNELSSNVQGLFDEGKKIDEIAKITKLSITKINKILG